MAAAKPLLAVGSIWEPQWGAEGVGASAERSLWVGWIGSNPQPLMRWGRIRSFGEPDCNLRIRTAADPDPAPCSAPMQRTAA